MWFFSTELESGHAAMDNRKLDDEDETLINAGISGSSSVQVRRSSSNSNSLAACDLWLFQRSGSFFSQDSCRLKGFQLLNGVVLDRCFVLRALLPCWC